MTTLRPYQPKDLDALYRICLETGDAGRDATAAHNDDKLLGHIYSAPYGVLEPRNVFVAEDEDGVAGYVVGTHDTPGFAARLESEWWPTLREHYAKATDMSAADRARIATIMQPHSAPSEFITDYPAHIHMNLLPRLRGQRIGSRLLDMWVNQAKADNVRGIHLGASASNAGGIAFWSKYFNEIGRNGGAVWFGMQL